MMVSVIVPIYNVEDYLEECLESLVNQKFDEYEVILINDGSTDNSKDIAEDYAKRYDRMKLINTSNNGLSAARNVGIENSIGEYLVFVDSDDYVSDIFLNKLYKTITKYKSDITICSYEEIYINKDLNKVKNMVINEEKIYSNIEVLKMLLECKIPCYAWNKIYKSELFKKYNIKYPIGKLYEDVSTFVHLITKCEKISFINQPLYKYRIRRGSITNTKNEQAIVGINYAIDQVNTLIFQEYLGSKVSDELVNFNLKYSLNALDILSEISNYKSRSFYNLYKEKFKKGYFEYDIKQVLLNKKIKKWVVRDFILFKFGLLPLKNKLISGRGL